MKINLRSYTYDHLPMEAINTISAKNYGVDTDTFFWLVLLKERTKPRTHVVAKAVKITNFSRVINLHIL